MYCRPWRLKLLTQSNYTVYHQFKYLRCHFKNSILSWEKERERERERERLMLSWSISVLDSGSKSFIEMCRISCAVWTVFLNIMIKRSDISPWVWSWPFQILLCLWVSFFYHILWYVATNSVVCAVFLFFMVICLSVNCSDFTLNSY